MIWYIGRPTYVPNGGTDGVACRPRTSVPANASSVPDDWSRPPTLTSDVTVMLLVKTAALNSNGGGEGRGGGDGAGGGGDGGGAPAEAIGGGEGSGGGADGGGGGNSAAAGGGDGSHPGTVPNAAQNSATVIPFWHAQHTAVASVQQGAGGGDGAAGGGEGAGGGGDGGGGDTSTAGGGDGSGGGGDGGGVTDDTIGGGDGSGGGGDGGGLDAAGRSPVSTCGARMLPTLPFTSNVSVSARAIVLLPITN